MIHELLHVNVLQDYSDLLSGLGVLNRGFKYKVPIDNSVLPKKCSGALLLHWLFILFLLVERLPKYNMH